MPRESPASRTIRAWESSSGCVDAMLMPLQNFSDGTDSRHSVIGKQRTMHPRSILQAFSRTALLREQLRA